MVIRLLIAYLLYLPALFAQNPFHEACFEHASCAFVVKNSEGKVLRAYNEQLALQPASIMKLLVTGIALKELGPHHRIETTLFYTGSIHEGILDGHLLIQGGGDPSLGSNRLAYSDPIPTWLAEMQRQGLKEVKGDMLVDLSAWGRDYFPMTWQWGDIGNYYGAFSSGMNYMENTYHLTLRSGDAGELAEVLSIVPDFEDLHLESEVVAAKIKYDDAYIMGGNLSSRRLLIGRIPEQRSSFVIKGAMKNPARVFLHTFRAALEAKGIVVKGSLRVDYGGLDVEVKPWMSYLSPCVQDLVEVTNKESQNLYAEALLRLVFEHRTSLDSCLSALHVYCKDRLGLCLSGLRIKDASGLSRVNAITADFFTDFLVSMLASSARDHFLASLPRAGKEGTVRNFLRGSKLGGKVWVKSGTMEGVMCYAGYILKDASYYPFCIMVNNYSGSASACRKAIEDLLIEQCEVLD